MKPSTKLSILTGLVFVALSSSAFAVPSCLTGNGTIQPNKQSTCTIGNGINFTNNLDGSFQWREVAKQYAIVDVYSDTYKGLPNNACTPGATMITYVITIPQGASNLFFTAEDVMNQNLPGGLIVSYQGQATCGSDGSW